MGICRCIISYNWYIRPSNHQTKIRGKVMTGTVKEYDKAKGFGFISGDDGEDYF